MHTPMIFQYYNNYSNQNYGTHCLAFEDIQGNVFYFSYKTLVAFYVARTNKRFCLKNYWGPTTGKHLSAIEPDKEKRISLEEFNNIYKAAFNSEAKIEVTV